MAYDTPQTNVSGRHALAAIRGPYLTIVALISLTLLMSGTPASGLWLPWATQRDMIQKRLNDIWSALISKDTYSLGHYLVGSRRDFFVNHERKIIEHEKISEFDIVIRKLRFDDRSGRRAFVVFQKVGTTEDGKRIFGVFFRVMKNEGGEWKLVTDAPRTQQDKERKKQMMRIEREKPRTVTDKNGNVTVIQRSRLIAPSDVIME